MICPKCEIGTIRKIQFKYNNTHATLCEYCGALWLEGVDINAQSSHQVESYLANDDREYSFDEIEERTDIEPLVPVKFH